VGPQELEKVIRQDVALSYKVLRCVNSSYYGLGKKIESLSHGIVYLGVRHIRNWARLLLAGSLDDQPAEVFRIALLRARMCELLAEKRLRESQDAAFTLGMFSILPALINIDMNELLERVPLSDPLQQALLHEQGQYADLLITVRAYERGDWAALKDMPFSPRDLSHAYLTALDWTDTTYGAARQA
jgi:EAL and modified HD-GYP domain-containing signal transduction protein